MTPSKNTPEWEPTNYHSLTRGIYSDAEYKRRNTQLTKEEELYFIREEAGLRKEARKSSEEHDP